MAPPIIVFDLDDTLYAERDFAISGFKACERWMEERFGVGGIVADMTRMLDDGYMRRLFVEVLQARVPQSTPGHLEEFIDVYRLHEPEIALYPDAAWALDHYGRGGPIGLITDGQHEVQSSKVKALAIEHHFDHIVYTHALGGRSYSKPHPLSYEQMEAAIGAEGRRLVYIGDNPSKDFVTPNARGWISVQIHRPMRIHSRAEVAAGGAPQHEIRSLDELPALLSGLAP